MRVCPSCEQHVLFRELSCPFCGTPFPESTLAPVVKTLTVAAAFLGIGIGCGPQIEPMGSGTTQGMGSSGSSVGSTPMTSSTGPMSTSTVGTTMDESTSMMTADSTASSGTSINFIMDPDGGGVAYGECDVFVEDCPRGEKCMPWANDGGMRWNATRCSKIEEDAGQPGEPCMAVDSPYSGRDDCDLGVMCFNVDPKSLEGTCHAFCEGDRSNPTCADASRVCAISHDGALALCLLPCDPLAQDCPDGMNCAYHDEQFVCIPTGGAALGEECVYSNDCQAPLSCVPGATPECMDSCCTQACDPLLDDCMLMGQACEPVEPGGDVGLCASP